MSDKQLFQISNWNSYQNPLDNVLGTDTICPTITTRIAESQDGGINVSMKVVCEEFTKNKNLRNINKHLKQTLETNYLNKIEDASYINAYNRNIRNDGISGTISTRVDASNDIYIAIKNNTKKGYLESYEGDGIDISGRMKSHRGTIQKGMAQTIKTSIDVGVVEKKNNLKTQLCNELILNGKVKENDIIRHSYSNSRMKEWEHRNIEQNNISPTLDTRCDCSVVCVKFKKDTKNYIEWEQKGRLDLDCRAWEENCIAPTNTTISKTKVLLENPLRIRKLTPKECFRLMGVKDEDYENIAKNQSNSKLYHLAGDSIVVNVLMAIFKQML